MKGRNGWIRKRKTEQVVKWGKTKDGVDEWVDG